MSETPLAASLSHQQIEQILSAAHWAPFHKPCEAGHRQGELKSKVPWRVYVVASEHCRELADRVPTQNAGKIPSMLRAAEALIQVTWLPSGSTEHDVDSSKGEATFVGNRLNMEHIAAASAAVQNLLLAATAAGVPSYWSSGGVLRTQEVFECLGMATSEILIGSVFLFPNDTNSIVDSAKVVGSKLRDQRGTAKDWSTWVQPDGNKG